jgi:acetolactate synthase-1/2/3 large subunit
LRSAPIHWGQENFRGRAVREQVSLERAGQPVDEVLGRALDIALAEPRGPVYLTLPREVLADSERASVRPLPQTELAAPQPSAQHIDMLADWVASAEWPMILTANLGRDTAAVGVLAELAQRHAIPVVQPHASCVNLPSSHGFNLGPVRLILSSSRSEVPWYSYFSLRMRKSCTASIPWSRYPPSFFPRSSRLPAARAAPRRLPNLASAPHGSGGGRRCRAVR